MSRIRTLEFLPEIFQTPTNSQFLGATLDQLVNPPVKKTIQGYVGSKIGYGVNAKNYYVTEPTKERTDYQLDPGVVFTKENESVAKDFITYPGIIDSLDLQNDITDNNNNLFTSEIYSFDPFCSFDPIINFNQYYWLPNGLPAVTVSTDTVFSINDYIVTKTPSSYNIRAVSAASGSNNPTLTLLRNGTYTFEVKQDSKFWIQGEPGLSGYSQSQPNQSVRDIYGVSNNGANVGTIIFNVPSKDAQNDYIFPGNNPVDLISTRPAYLPADDPNNTKHLQPVNGARLADIGNIDGVTALNGRTVVFYDTGIDDEIGYESNFYDMGEYDTNYGNIVATQTITATVTDNTGNITVSDTANLILNNSITFTGTSFGGLQSYQSSANPVISATSMTLGQRYYIETLGNTDWITSGVIPSYTIPEAEIVGTQLILTNPSVGEVNVGQTVTGLGVTQGTVITEYDPIATEINGSPTYTVNNSQTVAPTAMNFYNIKPGTIFSCLSVPVTGTGTVVQYNPTIYYITSIDTMTNTIQVSESLGGSVFLTSPDSGTMTGYINQGLYEESGPPTHVNRTVYLIEYIGDMLDPVLRLIPYATIPLQQNIIPLYGEDYAGLKFVKRFIDSEIELLPYISAPLDTLYYQDSVNPNCVGKIKLIESNITNTLNVETDILGKTNYTAPNGVVFTNGLKVKFEGDIIPVSYLTGEYYVEGVGTTTSDGGGIQLIPVDSLVITEQIEPTVQDYITIARNSLNKNPWARSNRWFHDQVIHATAEYIGNPEILDSANANNKAKRPIIQFYPNLKLYNSGTYGKETVDFIDFRTTDAFTYIENQERYYPDVGTYTSYQGTINTNTTPVYAEEAIKGQWYEINNLSSTKAETWELLGATLTYDGSFETGVEYIITDVGTTTQAAWNTIAGTIGITYYVGDRFTAVATGNGAGTGNALTVLFKATSNGVTSSQNITAGLLYKIISLGTTQWNDISTPTLRSWGGGIPNVGGLFYATGPGIGTGTVSQGGGTIINKSLVHVNIAVDQVTGTLEVGQYINDLILNQASQLPNESRILTIDEVGSSYDITVYYPIPASIAGATSVSFVASTEDTIGTLDNKLALFDGARIVFANESDQITKNKIYVVNFSDTGSQTYPVITLTEAYDGEILENDQFPVKYGFNYQGKSFYLSNDTLIEAQQKTTQNQAPLFDIFDDNGISYSNPDFYNSTTFKGCKLFSYQIGTGLNDPVLGFPITYSSFKNVNDIRFEVSLYTDTFTYVRNSTTNTSVVSNGYIYNYITRDEHNRMIGWQTSIATSQQYQVFEFNYVANITPLVLTPGQTIDFTVTCDVPQLDVADTIWPSLQVFSNNNLLTEGTDYTVVNTDSSTVITIMLSQDVDTPFEVLILSDQVSESAYYTIPINLSNNPFNSNPNSIDLGDIRGQYQSIYINNTNFEGMMFGSNNYRDLGNLVPYGNRIIQNSASLVLPGAFLRSPDTNLFDALMFNSREYIKFKTLLVDTVNRIANNQKYDPATLLDQAMDEITSSKTQELPFFWSDMMPNKSAYITNIYNFANGQDTSIFPLSKIYDFTSANYDGVLVYLLRKITGVLVTKQFVKGIDYTVSTDSPSLTVTTDLIAGDKIIVKEFNATYGSYIPNTPTKLGLYPAYIPQVIYDTTYTNPTWFIQGHDGSLNKLYGEYDETLGMCVDFRDQILLEFETRVYNNLKIDRTTPILPAMVIPGYFRETPLSYEQYTEMYSTNFLSWVGQNRLNYKTQVYNSSDEWSYNYRNSKSRLDNTVSIMQGNWRGVYTYFFDTATPNTTPWEMIGYVNKPVWWEDRYGPAPYTSDNLILWTDMENGYDYNNGNPVTLDIFKRPNLLDILPVDSAGNLKSPLNSVVGNYNPYLWNRDWIVGDDAPVEFSYRNSSTYPFDLMRLQALIKPAMFYNLAVDLDNYKYNYEFNQYLVNNRTHLVPSEIQIYGNGTAKTSYINWIVDYQKQFGVDATTKITTLLDNLDVRLIYRLAGFSDKSLLKFFVEKGSPGSPNPSLLIPDESYQVLLYNNVPSDKIVYSGVIVQKLNDGYAVYGNNQTSAYFKILKPLFNGKKINITVQDVTISVATEYASTIVYVPYGTIYTTEEELSQFLLAYGRYLESQGMKFEYQSNSVVFDWVTMVQEFLYWAQSGWSTGSVVTLNPSAENLTIDKESLIVQPLTYASTNFILNNNLYPIQNKDLNIMRDGTKFDVKPLNEGDALTYGQFDLSNIEHGIVFNNVTLFNDVIYNLQTGLRQNRIYVRGTKSAEWNGTMFASGFIYNQDNITEWQAGVKYTQGSIVKFKNKYFTALKIVQPNSKFVQNEWKETNYNEIQKGLLPNSSTRSAESALYYDVDKANLEQDADLLSFSLIGFRPREYMASADLTDITQVNVYKNLIKDKGTLNAMKAFKGAQLPQGGIDYDIYENWAILQGAYGGLLNNNYIEFALNENLLTNNPSIVGLTDGNEVEGAQQLVPLYALVNYERPITSTNVLPLTEDIYSSLFPDAGYVNINDVKSMAYYYSNLPSAVDKNNIIVPLTDLYVNDYIWLANFKATWQILTPVSIGQVIKVSANLDDTSTVLFKSKHNLSQYDIFAIINFDTAVNGYFIVTQVKNQQEVLINLILPAQTRTITGQGIGLKFQSHRASKPGNIQNLPLLNNEFVKNKAWVDEGTDGTWQVYRKSINYQYALDFIRPDSVNFGAAVAHTPKAGYLLSDPYVEDPSFGTVGKVYRYRYDDTIKSYIVDQTLTNFQSFGTSIVHEQNIYAISQPNYQPAVYIYTINNTTVSDDIILYQKILASTIDPAITSFGDAMALSGDLNWLYISDYNKNSTPARNNVHVLRKANEQVTSLVYGVTYQITEVGTTDFTLYGAVDNKVGIYFIADATVSIVGTGIATRCNYEYVTTLSSLVISTDEFGKSLSTNYYGNMLFVGVPHENYTIDIENWGRTYVYNRLVQNILMDAPYGTNPSYTLAWTPGTKPVTVSRNGVVVDSSNYSIVGNTITYYYTILPDLSPSWIPGDILNISGCEFVKIQTLETQQTPRLGVAFGTSVDNNTHATEAIVGAPYALSSTNQEGAGYRFTYAGAKFGVITGTSDTLVTTDRTILLNGYLVVIPAGNAAMVAEAINNANVINVQAANSNGKLIISVIKQNIAEAEQKLTLSVVDPATLTELGINIYTQTQVILCPHVYGPTQFGTVIKFNDEGSVAISAPVGTRFVQTLFDFTDDENLDNDTVFDNNSTQFIDTYPNMGAVYIYDYLENYNESLSNLGAYTYAQSVNAKNQYSGSLPRYGESLDFNINTIVIAAPDFRQENVDGQVTVYMNITGEQDWTVYRHPGETVDINKIQNIQLFSLETNNTLVNLDYIDPSQGKILGAVRQNIDVISNIDPANYNNGTSVTGLVWGAEQVGSIWLDTTNLRYVNYHQNDNAYNAKFWATLFPGSTVAVYSWVASNVTPINYQGPGTPRNLQNYTVQSTLNASNVVTPVYYFWVRNTSIIFTKTGKSLADSNLETYINNPMQSGISYLAPLASNAMALYNCKSYINASDTILNIGYSNNSQDNPSHQEYALIRQNYANDFLPGLPNTGYYLVPQSLYNRLLESLSGTDDSGAEVPNPFLPKLVQSGVLARPRQSFFYDRYAALKNYIQYANAVVKQYPITETRTQALNGFLQESGTYYDTPMYWERINWWADGYDNNTKSTVQVHTYADLSALSVATGTIVTVQENGNGLSETYRYSTVENYDGNYVSTNTYLPTRIVTYKNVNYISLINVPANIFPTNSNYWEVYSEDISVWTRIGLANGTIQFKDTLYDYKSAGYGFDGTGFDTDVYDLYPSQETYWIVRALTEQIYIDELLIHRNKSLVLLFEYIQEETVENQNYLPWLNKTSLVDVTHKIRELKPIQNYLSDNQEFLSGYVNETKPYHVVIKEFLFDYTGTEVYPGNITDFDVPARYNSSIDTFVSPELVYDVAGNPYQYTTSSTIWDDQEYKEWFNNYGIAVGQYNQNNDLIGQPNYPIAKLMSYMSPTSESLVVDSIEGFPTNGTIKINDIVNPTEYELIEYTIVDRQNNTLSGLTRGVADDQHKNGTTVTSHIPGMTIYMDLPAVILLDGGKAYAEPPKVVAVIPDGYPEPRVAAEFKVVMSLDTVSEIIVLNPGSGYVVTPEIKIDPSVIYTFNSANVDIVTNTVHVNGTELKTGDLVRYVTGDSNIAGLQNNQWYYIKVIGVIPALSVAFYQSYSDADQDMNRLTLTSQGSGEHAIQLGAKAFAIPVSSPVRENNLTLRFDRTTYNTQVIDWTANAFYGAEFVGYYQGYTPYYLQSAGSGLQLESVQPDIYTVLASAEGTVFPIEAVNNQHELIWSTGPDDGLRTVGNISNSQIKLSFTSSTEDQYPTRSTVGFTVGMPVKFTGDVGSNIVENQTYYVAEVIDLEYFTIADTQYGPALSLTNYIPSDTLYCITGTITDTAIITTVYPGIRQITQTFKPTDGSSVNNNTVQVALTFGNTGGTTGLYTNIPVHFTGTSFGNIEINKIYYVVSVIDDQNFTLSTEENPLSVEVTETTAIDQIVCSDTTGYAAGDPVVFDSMVIADTAVTSFGNIVKGQIYYIKEVVNNKVITISTTKYGTVFNTGIVLPADNTYCYVTSQSSCLQLTDGTGNMTMNVGMPVSPGQVDGQQFTFYTTGFGDPVTNYYLKVDSATTFKVYSDPLFTEPVSGLDFPYTSGSVMLLPEPFFFKPSIVKYKNRAWLCVVSNNDPEFVVGNWVELTSGDSRLNALDRAKLYYAPTINMPGYDLTQLFTGLTYPNTTYKGNAFETIEQYILDTQLRDQPFSPTNIDIPAIIFNGLNYLAPANLPNYAAIIADLEVSNDWLLAKMSNQTLAFTDILYANGMYVITSANSPTPLFKSSDYQAWSTSGWFVPYGTTIPNIEFDKQRLIASGLVLNSIANNDTQYVAVGQNIITTDDLTYWYERLVLDSTNKKFYSVSYVQTTGFTGYVAVGINGSSNGIIYISTDGVDWTETTPVTNTNYYGVSYGLDTIFVVGANRTILSSSDGTTWSVVASGTGLLNDITFADNTLVTVGENGIVLTSTDGISWIQSVTPTAETLNSVIYVELLDQWTVVGDNNIILQTDDITTLPVVWEPTQLFSTPNPEYTVQGDKFLSGYGPEELVPGIVKDQLTMIVNTRAGTNWPATEYAHVGYNVKSIQLDFDVANVYNFNNVTQTPSLISVYRLTDGLGVALYETMDYTVDWVNKTVSLINPLVSGEQIRIDVYETGNGNQLVESSTDESPITTNGSTGFDEVFLNCSYSGNGYTGGGIVDTNTGAFYTEPAVFYNGMTLMSGVTGYIISTSSTNNTLTTYSTTNLSVDQRITFANDIFGGINPLTSYYIKAILSATEFTISDTQGGSEFIPTTATGTSVFVTEDYAVALADDQVNAKVIFADNYDLETDYIAYTFYGETVPQYGFTIPQTQIFAGDNTVGPYTLTNDLSGANATNAVVEINGLRINPTEYVINYYASSLTFSSLTPSTSDTIAVTTYNDTQRQYLVTNSYTNIQVTPIFYVFNSITISDPTVKISTVVPHNLNTNDVIRINGVVGSDQLNNRLFIVEVINATEFRIYSYIHGVIYTNADPVTTVNSYISGGYVSKYQSLILADTYATDNDSEYITVLDTTGLVEGTPVYFTQYGPYIGAELNAGSFLPGIIYRITVLGTTDWNAVAGTSGSTYSVGDVLVARYVGAGTGKAEIYFPCVDIGYPLSAIPDLIAGQKYYIKEVIAGTISISETYGGDAITLTTNTGPLYNVCVTQWQQTNVDRLWVTINGMRVASGSLRLNQANDVSILVNTTTTDEIVVTSMMPSATPDSQTYIQIVDQNNEGMVYRANPETTTWTTEVMNEYYTTMTVHDVTKLIYVNVQDSIAPAMVMGYYGIGLMANKNEILQIEVYNTNPARLGYIAQGYMEVAVTGLGPTLLIKGGSYIEAGDELVITITLGRLIYVNGEYMAITGFDLNENTIAVERGVMGSPILSYIPVNSTVYSLLDKNRMSNANYNDTWNKIPGIYNTQLGDPLQIARGSAPEFLRINHEVDI